MAAVPSKARRRAAPLICALILIALLGGLIAAVLWARTALGLPLWVAAVYKALYGISILCILAALIQRLREIEKGEEDEAVQY